MCCGQPAPRVDSISVKHLCTVSIFVSHIIRSFSFEFPGLRPPRNRYRPVLNLVWEAGMLVISGARGRDIRRRRCGR
jgi:hypothetical protein